METKKYIRIIIAEDDDGHAELIREAIEEAGVKNPIVRFRNGEQCWSFFENEIENGFDGTNDFGFLLLLDINMPGMGGIEVLKRVKQSPKLKSIPVIMLTTTDDPREVNECYKIGCNIYMTKPIDYQEFTETLKRLGLFKQIVQI